MDAHVAKLVTGMLARGAVKQAPRIQATACLRGSPMDWPARSFARYTRRPHLGRSRVPCLAVGVLSLAYERNSAVSGKSGDFLPTDEMARVVAGEEHGTFGLNDALVSCVHRRVTRDVNPRAKTVRDATPADAYGRLQIARMAGMKSFNRLARGVELCRKVHGFKDTSVFNVITGDDHAFF